MNYIKAIEIKCRNVTLNSGEVVLERMPLKEHYMLREIATRLISQDTNVKLNAIFDYVAIAAPHIDVYTLTVEELVFIYNTVLELNDDIELLPWQTTFQENVKHRTTNADYEGRELSVLLHELAKNYGWSEQQILSMQPEAAFCYMQEILLGYWEQDEFTYKMSEVAYDEKGKYKPFPKPIWLIEKIGPTEEEAKAMIPKRFVPDGVVIDNRKNK